MIRLMQQHGELARRTHRVMTDSGLKTISDAGEASIARTTPRHSPQLVREKPDTTDTSTPDVSQGTLIRTGLMQGFGIGFVFVPLGTVAFGTLAPALRTQGAGLFNLMPNIGASIGISMMSYLLVRNSVITQAALVEHITPYRQVVRDYAHQLNLATLSGRAALTQMVTLQAEAVAFIGNFKLMMFVSFLAIPLVILVQRAPHGDKNPAGTLAKA